MILCISVPSRIHVTLIDLGATGYRRNGGIGFCVDSPSVKLLFEKHHTIDFSALLDYGFTNSEVNKLTKRVNEVKIRINALDGFRIKNVQMPFHHTGLGTGTATTLACLEALHLFNERMVEMSDLITMSGRGGTSGIGINGYFSGGFIFDVGRRYDNRELVSSDNIDTPSSIPLTIIKSQMPSWPIGLIKFSSLDPISLEIEQKLFQSVLPLEQKDVFETTYHVVFGAIAALQDSDFNSFCDAINAIQNCAWKENEIKLHGMLLQQYIAQLKELGCNAVGLTSLGPTLYFLSKDFQATLDRIRQRFSDADIVTTYPANYGRRISYA